MYAAAMQVPRKRSSAPHVALAIYVTVVLLCVTWPGYDLIANRIEPLVLGLPFTLAWYAGWAVMTFLVMALYLAKTERGG